MAARALAVEGGDVRPPPGQHGRFLTFCDVFGPGGDHLIERLLPVRGGLDPLVLGVPVDGLFDVPRPQLGQHGPFFGVGLADVLCKGVHAAPVTGNESFEAAARADGAELAVVTNDDQLRPGRLGGGRAGGAWRGRRSCPPRRRHTTVRLSSLSWPWSSRHSSDAMVRGYVGARRVAELVVGVAGAGKSTALDAAGQAFEAARFKVLGTAVSGQAARTLGDGGGGRSTSTPWCPTTSRPSGSATAGPNRKSPTGSAGSPATRLPQASISAMERGFDGERRRRFDAHELYLLSVLFEVPIAYFFVPPPGSKRTRLADTGDLVTSLYAAVLGDERQLAPLDERLAEIGIKNPEEADQALVAVLGAEDRHRGLARPLPGLAQTAATPGLTWPTRSARLLHRWST